MVLLLLLLYTLDKVGLYSFNAEAPIGNKVSLNCFVASVQRFMTTVAILSDLTQDGKFAYFTLATGNYIAALYISDLNNIKRLHDPDQDQGIVGPHYVKASLDQKHLLVTDYFVQAVDISVLNTPADCKAQWTGIGNNGSLYFNRSIDFPANFSHHGGAKLHLAIIFDLTDVQNPKYYQINSFTGSNVKFAHSFTKESLL